MENQGQQEMKGRSRLKGVLDDLVQQSKEEREIEGVAQMVDEDVEEGARDLMELNEDSTSMARKRARLRSPGRRRGRKRQCRDVYYHSQDSDNSDSENRHIPHIMTLFDRKVDLARFTADTPLYVMCREWMWNNPSAATQNGGQTPCTESDPLNLLPPPTPLARKARSGAIVRLDVPKLLPRHTASWKELDARLNESKYTTSDLHDLKMEHLNRWRRIRDMWRRASALNQQRYANSLQQLRKMFQR